MIKKNFFKNNIINANLFLNQALKKLDQCNIKILFVEKKSKIVGTLTDGDIRRILLKENNLNISIENKYNKNFLFFLEKKFNHNKANKIMKKKKIFIVPILNHKKELKNLYFFNQLAERKSKVDVFILAGGMGKRLAPLTEKNPKPMLLIGGKPILERIILSFKEFGMLDFFISINYLGKKIQNYFRNGRKLNVNINYLKERTPLGTAGSLSLLRKKSKSRHLIVINGDVFVKLNYINLLNFHQDNHNDITICSRYFSQTIPYGILNADYKKLSDKQIVNEKPTYKFQISAGIYIFNYNLLNNIKKNEHLDMNTLLNRFSINKKIGIFPIYENLIDIGDYKSYQDANLNFFK